MFENAEFNGGSCWRHLCSSISLALFVAFGVFYFICLPFASAQQASGEPREKEPVIEEHGMLARVIAEGRSTKKQFYFVFEPTEPRCESGDSEIAIYENCKYEMTARLYVKIDDVYTPVRARDLGQGEFD
jgi:hypothetical protein